MFLYIEIIILFKKRKHLQRLCSDLFSKQMPTHRNVMHLVWRGCQTLLYPGRVKTSCGPSYRTTLFCRQVQQLLKVLLHRFWVTGSSLSNRCIGINELACNSHEQTHSHTHSHLAGWYYSVCLWSQLWSRSKRWNSQNNIFIWCSFILSTNFSCFYCSQWFPCISPFEHPLEKEQDVVLWVAAESISGVKWQIFWLRKSKSHVSNLAPTSLVAAL